MDKKRNPTFAKFLISYLIVLLLPFLIVWFFLYSHFEKLQTEQAISSAQNTLNQMKNLMDSKINEIYSISARISAEQELSPYFLENFYNVYRSQKLLGYTTHSDFFDDVKYYVRGTNSLYSASSTYTLPIYYRLSTYTNWSYEDLTNELNNLRHPLLRPSEPVVLNGREEKVITYLVPIPNNSAYPYATTIFTIKESDIRKLFAPIVKEPDSDVAVIDSDGRIVFSLADQSYTAAAAAEITRSSDNKQGVYEWREGDLKLVALLIPSQETKLTYIQFVPEKYLMRPIEELREKSTITFILMLIAGSAIIYSMMYVNYNPVKALSLQFQELHGRIARQQEQSLPALQQYYARGLLKGKYDSRDNFNEMAEGTGLTLRSDAYYVAVLQINSPGEGEATFMHDYAKLWLNALNEHEEGYYVEFFENNRIALIVSETGDTYHRATWEERHRALYTQTKVEATVALGNSYERLSDISKSFFEASTALQHRWIKGQNGVIIYREIGTEQPVINWYPSQELEMLTSAVRQGDLKTVMTAVGVCLENIKRHSVTMVMARFLCYEVVNTLLKTVMDERPNGLQSVVLPGILLLTDLETFEQLEHTVLEIAQEVAARLSADPPEQDASNGNRLLDAIFEYINQSYSSYEFSMQRMAEHLSLSSKYLGTFFKEHTGKTVIEYVNEIRLEKAKKLLRDSNKQIQDIVVEVGFLDASSFIRKFKKETRITPGEYRKLHMK